MKIISHRGNLSGPSEFENHPEQLLKAINSGFDVELDVRSIDGHLFLGHDEAQYPVSSEFLKENAPRFWVHCKNLESLVELSKFPEINLFWHQTDDFVLTRSGHIWTFPGKRLCESSVAVMPELTEGWEIEDAFAVCTDYPFNFRKQ